LSWFILIVVGLSVVWALNRNGTKEYLVSKGLKSSLAKKDKAILSRYFEYYNSLPPKSKLIFEYRVRRFIELKNFIPRDMAKVTDEMQVLIAASAVQLAFGFSDIFLSHFENIVVYPDQFFSNAGQREHKGEVNPKAKAIVLSWKHFTEGYASKEGVNLGLHEMAHALQLENIVMNNEYDFLDEDHIKHWQQLASAEITKIRSGESGFFREYAGTNHAEFFAVAIENFFERPAEFKAYHQELYAALRDLINQDPGILVG
jgi:MtfA peptidase